MLKATGSFLFLLISMIVTQASAVKSFPPGEDLFWQLSGAVKTNKSAPVYDIDLEDNEHSGLITRLKGNGKKVICYFSGGTYENWRSDASQFPSSALGKALPDWPGERWLDIRKAAVRAVIEKRLARAAAAGCDAVEPDNVDGYDNNNGLGLTANDQINYLHWMAATAHAKGIAIGLKNSLGIIRSGKLHQHFDWALNEQCYQYGECGSLADFIAVGKAVYIAEYKAYSSANCSNAKRNQFSLAFYDLSLNGAKWQPCR